MEEQKKLRDQTISNSPLSLGHGFRSKMYASDADTVLEKATGEIGQMMENCASLTEIKNGVETAKHFINIIEKHMNTVNDFVKAGENRLKNYYNAENAR